MTEEDRQPHNEAACDDEKCLEARCRKLAAREADPRQDRRQVFGRGADPRVSRPK